MSKRIFRVLGVLMALHIMLSLPVHGIAAAGEERSKTVNLGITRAPRTIDPGDCYDDGSENSVRMVYEPLVWSDHTGKKYTPGLAKSWSSSDDKRSWTFQLHDNITFSNGDKMTADDVVYCFERMMKEGNMLQLYVQYFANMISVEKLGDYEVKFTFENPFPQALTSFIHAYIFNSSIHKEMGNEMFFEAEYAVGTGPWKLVEWIDGQYTHFVKNEDYWGDFDSYFEEVYIRHIIEQQTGVAAHVSGQLDTYTPEIGIQYSLQSLYNGTEDAIELFTVQQTKPLFITLQFKDSIFSDIRARQALSLAIDRQALIDNVQDGLAIPMVGFWPKGTLGYDSTIEPYEYNPEKARKLLAETGYDGTKLEVLISPNMVNSQEYGLAFQDMANAVGFNIEVLFLDYNTFAPRRNTGAYNGGYIGPTDLVDGTVNQHLTSNLLRDNYGTHYYDAELFSLFREAIAELDADRYIELAKQINRELTRELPQIMFSQIVTVYAVNYGIVGIDYWFDGRMNFNWVDWDPDSKGYGNISYEE